MPTRLDLGRAPDDLVLSKTDFVAVQRQGGEMWMRAGDFGGVPWSIGPGAGITSGTGTVCKTWRMGMGGIIYSGLLIDLTGLTISGAAGDIIGKDASTAPAYLGQITNADHGSIMGVRMTCLETPAGGDTDIDLYSATEGTGIENGAVASLTETQIINAGASSAGSVDYAVTIAADQYLYLVGQTGGDAAYTAGRLMIEMWGVRV